MYGQPRPAAGRAAPRGNAPGAAAPRGRAPEPFDLRALQMAEMEAEMAEEAAGGGGGGRRAPAPGRGPGPAPASRRGPPAAGGGRERFEPTWTDETRVFDLPPTAALPPPGLPVTRRTERGVGLDVHELLKREAFASPNGSCDSHFEKSRPCPTDIYGVADHYMVLDSWNKDQSGSDLAQGRIKFNFMVQGLTGDQVIGVKDICDTIVEIEVYPFNFPVLELIPYTPAAATPTAASSANNLLLLNANSGVIPGYSAAAAVDLLSFPYVDAPGPGGIPVVIPTPAWPPAPLPVIAPTPYYGLPNVSPLTQIPFCSHLTIQMVELGLQSYSDRLNTRHHFECRAKWSTSGGGAPYNTLDVAPLSGMEVFNFTEPIQDIHGLTLVFRNPDVPIAMLPDCYYYTQTGADHDLYAAFSSAGWPQPYLAFNVPGNRLTEGDRIFVSGYKSGNPQLDNYVNGANGLVVSLNDPRTGLPPTGATAAAAGNIFWTNPTISVFNYLPLALQSTTVCIAKRRIRIPIRMRGVVQRLTNYKTL